MIVIVCHCAGKSGGTAKQKPKPKPATKVKAKAKAGEDVTPKATKTKAIPIQKPASAPDEEQITIVTLTDGDKVTLTRKDRRDHGNALTNAQDTLVCE